MNRRKFVTKTGAFLLSLAFTRMCGYAETSATSGSSRSYREEMPDMLVSHLTGNLNRLASTRDRRRAHLATPTDVEARNSFVGEKLLLMLCGLPQKSLLRAVTVKTAEKEGYRVENVMFCSRPDFRQRSISWNHFSVWALSTG